MRCAFYRVIVRRTRAPIPWQAMRKSRVSGTEFVPAVASFLDHFVGSVRPGQDRQLRITQNTIVSCS